MLFLLNGRRRGFGLCPGARRQRYQHKCDRKQVLGGFHNTTVLSILIFYVRLPFRGGGNLMRSETSFGSHDPDNTSRLTIMSIIIVDYMDNIAIVLPAMERLV